MIYNGLVTLRVRIKEAWSGIEVQLKRRSSLIPNLIETVKGYTKHEKGVLEEVTKARTAFMNANSVKEKAKAENMLEGTLKTLKRFKDEVKEVRDSFECGMAFENYNDIREGDIIECFEIESIARKL